MIFSWSERMVNHIGIEKRSKRINAAAVRNIGQCASGVIQQYYVSGRVLILKLCRQWILWK